MDLGSESLSALNAVQTGTTPSNEHVGQMVSQPPSTSGGKPILTRSTGSTSRAVVLTLVLLPSLPLLVYYFWYCLSFGGGDFAMPSIDMFRRFPVPTAKSVIIVAGWLIFQALLQVYVPGEKVRGAPLGDGARLSYIINGWSVWWLTWILLISGAALGLYSPAALTDEFGALLTTTNIFAVLGGAYLYWHGKLHNGGQERITNNVICDLWLGTALNPRIGDFDLKLFLETRPGLIAWPVLDVAFAARQFERDGIVSGSMLLVCAFHFWYVADCFAHEQAILDTWDIRHENLGWMLCFGNLVWVPFTYTIQAQYLVYHSPDLSWWLIAAIVVLFVVGYGIFRGANRQKHRFRQSPDRIIWGQTAVSIRTSRGPSLLASGWWGLARHVNYLGDLLMGLAWCLPCGFNSPLPYFYAVYLSILLVHRERRDHAFCANRYGKDWDLYCAKVPYRIIPGLY